MMPMPPLMTLLELLRSGIITGKLPSTQFLTPMLIIPQVALLR